MYTKQLRELVVRPVLEQLHMWSESAENLVLGTCAQESRMGHYIHQIRGPALGIYQMEPATYKDIWENWILPRGWQRRFMLWSSNRSERVLYGPQGYYPKPTEMIGNLYFATAMCRAHYRRVHQALPPADDIQALGEYWKKYYNTYIGRGTVGEFIENYERYVDAL